MGVSCDLGVGDRRCASAGVVCGGRVCVGLCRLRAAVLACDVG